MCPLLSQTGPFSGRRRSHPIFPEDGSQTQTVPKTTPQNGVVPLFSSRPTQAEYLWALEFAKRRVTCPRRPHQTPHTPGCDVSRQRAARAALGRRSSRDRELIDDEYTSIPCDTDSYADIRNSACPSVRRAGTADSASTAVPPIHNINRANHSRDGEIGCGCLTTARAAAAVTSPPRTGIRDVFPKWRPALLGLTESGVIFDLRAAPRDVAGHTSMHPSIMNQRLQVSSARLFPTRPCVQPGSTPNKSPGAGLSPRVRGSHSPASAADAMGRSIPASTGQPFQWRTATPSDWVYPREYGAAEAMDISGIPQAGLSPRVRGSLFACVVEVEDERSIPASTGQPPYPVRGERSNRVYPREYGAAHYPYSSPTQTRGLSPRVRGSPHAPRVRFPVWRSIPASTGQPCGYNDVGLVKRVYPREYGAATVQPALPRLC